MTACASQEKVNLSNTMSLVRLSGKRMMRLIWRPRKRISVLMATLLAAWVPTFAQALDANTLPGQASVKVGNAQISQSGNQLVVNQSSSRLGLDWQTFSIGANGVVTFVQPGKDAVALNRVVGNDATQIFGQLSANGQVFLVNPNGVLFAPGSKVDVGGLVATTLNLTQEDFKSGKYQFVGVDASGKVLNQGDIKAAAGGYVALMGPQVKNEGSINVPTGQVVLAGGRAVTVDITGSGLIGAVVTQGAANSSAENSGTITAQGGVVRMTAKAAQDVAGGLVNNTGVIKASSLVNKNGEIWLMGDSVSNTGELRADGGATQAGGVIRIEAAAVALGGTVSADGSSGGKVLITAGQHLSLAENVTARGLSGHGGQVAYVSGGGILESSTSQTDASGSVDGGTISVLANSGVASSGSYHASGETGRGGRVDITGKTVHLLSANLDARGAQGGGRIRIGGGFQGGKDPVSPLTSAEANHLFVRRWEDSAELANASATFVNDGSSLDVSSTSGVGGTAIVWSDAQTTFLGAVDARGARSGGAVEISSGETLRRAALDRVQIGSGGQLLLDPKNLIIGDAEALKQWQYQGVLDSIYAWKASVPVLGSSDYLGYSVALNSDARLMAVGAIGDDGAAGSLTNAGAVHLFAFQDTSFGGGALVGTVGSGYIGGKNINVTLDASDEFGSGVALSSTGSQMAVGARYDDGYNNVLSNSGAVHLFTFTDTAFAGGVKSGTIGQGYVGSGDVSVTLGGSDLFGSSVAMSALGDRLAVGAPYDDGVSNNKYDSGAVHLFTFGTSWATGSKVGTVGSDYAGSGDSALAQRNYSHFGSSVAMSRNGLVMAVGADNDNGYAGALSSSGAVYLFNLDSNFKATKVGTLGSGYNGSGDLNVSLDSYDNFGVSVALNEDGTRLAVGATGDDGAQNSVSEAGAVHLYSFGPGLISGIRVATLGAGYGAVNDVNVTLDSSDYFGSGLAMSADAARLAVGAYGDNGAQNGLGNSGAVHLFAFTGGSFAGGQQLGAVGHNYRNDRGVGVNLDGQRSAGNDNAGFSVALNQNARLLAVGAVGDDAYGDRVGNAGAVHLITFADDNFGGASLAGTIGDGYSGGKNIDIRLDANDEFGSGVALSGDGLHLAVGARYDDGANNIKTDAGAVHLFKFTDSSFGGGYKTGTVGAGYTGAGDLNIALDANDYFGTSVALNTDGTRLAVGAPGDDGYNNAYYYYGDPGAVHLFTFADGNFGDGAKTGAMGSGYVATGDVNVTLDYYDYFGSAVAMTGDGTRLAVGATSDDGYNNSSYESGAVHLFSFGNGWTTGTPVGSVGVGYTGTGSTAIALDNYDHFGASVALNASGTVLAVGADQDDGSSNSRSYAGAVHLLTFTNGNFAGGALAGTIGHGYSGGRNVELSLDSYDYFGRSVALNATGNRLAVGASGDDGAGNDVSTAGAVHLFTFTDPAFNGGKLAGRIGNGYASGQALSLDVYGSKSWSGDQAGSAVALSADARQLAIGVPFDDGSGEKPWDDGNYGAVHLVTFTDGNFAGGTLAGTVGKGYSGGKNINVALDADDQFGSAVALSGDGKHLAVGARYDDGYNNSLSYSGAVHLFTFGDNAFASGQKTGTIGHGYAGAGNVNVSLGNYDYLGSSVALNTDGTRLAVGAPGDDGAAYAYESGAVQLFTFNSGFTGGLHVGTLGNGYTTALAPGNVPVALESYDYFGQSLALNGAGTLLAVGATGDDGEGNAYGNTGAVHLFSFGAGFTVGAKVGTIGRGYTGAKDVAVSLASSSGFANALGMSASGQQLVVGAPYDDGVSGDRWSSGAVHLFSFTDTSFSSGALVGTVGSGYAGGKNIESGAKSDDYFGWSVALNGDASRLAVGAPLADGAGEDRQDSGMVHLLGFSDSSFTSGRTLTQIGPGARAQASLSLNLQGSQYWNADLAGTAVALSGDARQLAVGAPGDAGADPSLLASRSFGAVHLVTFTDGNFAGGALAGTVGKGYSGGKNINMALDADDQFGSAVALSGDGKYLAVGARYDDGYNNSLYNSGAVHLFTFGDSTFASGQKTGTIGHSYSGTGNVNLSLDYYDYFGSSLALNADGTRLAVGAPGDDGYNNAKYESGAVHLIAFTDGNFGGGAKVGTMGFGYVATGDVNVTLDYDDYFGSAVALSGDASRLAVGATGDDGNTNTVYDSGAVRLYSFADTSFGTSTSPGIVTIGSGYEGVSNLSLDYYDNFGSSIAMSRDATLLAVGASRDDGLNNSAYEIGAVHTFTFGNAFSGGAKVGTLGYGYSGSNDLDLSARYGTYANLGRALALNADGSRMAMGVASNSGASGLQTNAGAVELITLGAALTTPLRVGTVGQGYTGTASLDLPVWGEGSSQGEGLGSAVALSADAKLLAVGARGDVGAFAKAPLTNAGAVHLITFADDNFGGASLAGTIGHGYSGGKNIDIRLDANDEFGSGVALSGDGLHLAVGARYDDGANNIKTDAGAVHLFKFTDSSFGGGYKTGTVGAGYTGAGNLNIALDANDYFGTSVALNTVGTRLAVGAPGDDGYNGNYSYSDFGAVHLFTFADGNFGDGAKTGTMGFGYVATGDVNVTLDYDDYFGSAVAMTGDGTRLAVGATSDDGYNNTSSNSGAVHLFSFGNGWTTGTPVGSVGVGYTGTGSTAIALDNYDHFGASVALNAAGTVLAVGADQDDGSSNSRSYAGAVHLLTFTNGNFAGGALAGTIGHGYSGGRNVELSLDSYDYFGRSVALNATGNRLAVGASGDDGAGNDVSSAGAVHLFTFTGTDMSGGLAVGRVGQGYVSIAQALDVPFVGSGYSGSDQLGASVSLSGDARLLAVGLPNDVGNGAASLRAEQGAVHLITFTDGDFGGAQLAGTVGNGYTGGKNVNVALDAYDHFGSAVALSRDGLALAVGAQGDDGAGNRRSNAGAVHLFNFSDTAFSGGQKVATVGDGYTGPQDVSLALDADDAFGHSLALNTDGKRLAVGAAYDDGFNNSKYQSGAVHLFTFGDSTFASGQKTGTIGHSYSGTGNVNLSLDYYDYFGSAVALSGDASRLAVGATGDNGKAGTLSGSGAVHLFNFADTGFGTPTKSGTVGSGYAGAGDVNLVLGSSDSLGASLAFNTDGTRLAVGATGDDGALDNKTNAGAIHLIRFDNEFGAGVLEATVGASYAGPKDFNMTGLSSYDDLGTSVALSGDARRMAVGLINDNGQDNSRYGAGAVKLFKFADGNFGGARLAVTLGYGYRSESASLSLPWSGPVTYQGDAFGASVALNASGLQMAVGATGDDGYLNGKPASGAVYLFQFGGSGNANASLLGTMGSGYVGGKNVNVDLEAGDAFGAGVALSGDGTRLAVGASGDDGMLNQRTDSGAVHLFSFADNAWTSGLATGRIGYGYSGSGSGSGSLSMNSLDYADRFGSALALSGDGNLLAVGAPLDKGASNTYSSTSLGYGAVHLFALSSGVWGQTGTIGYGYTGTGSVDMGNALANTDNFGTSVTMAADGRMLAVGAPNDDGYNNASYDSGAVHLFTAGNGFSTPARVGTLGYGYVANLSDIDTQNNANLNLSSLTSSDYFGSAVAMTSVGTRLAVGTPGDDGGDVARTNSGAVHLFSFSGTAFADATRLSSVGVGYSAVGDLTQKLSSYDGFGSSLAFNADGSRLAVGAIGDDGMSKQLTGSGAVRVFNFADTTYAQGFEIAAIGQGRLPAHTSLPAVTTNDQFGAALALSSDGTRMAVGAPGDDGLANDRSDSGAVHLFRFTDGQFGGAQLQGTMGYGYSGGKNVNVDLGWGDNFGSAVALSGNASLLVVGAPRDDGASNDRLDAGALHLFTFSDSHFNRATKVGMVGYGYSGTDNHSLNQLGMQDYFGSSVALSQDGSKLVAGAPGDDAYNNSKTDSGAVYRVTFSDLSLGGAAFVGTVGSGYNGTGDLNVALDGYDGFGQSVALKADASAMVVGAPGDDGFNNVNNYYSSYYGSGAAHLFSFADTTFAAPTQVGTIGSGYVGAKDINVQLDNNDQLGSALAMNQDGSLLAVGAKGDDGQENARSDSGSVSMFTFSSTGFTGGKHSHTLGHGYNSIGQVPVTLSSNDAFGSALAINGVGDQLAVGAPGHDSTGGFTLTDTGRVYLFGSSILTPVTDLSAQTFATASAATSGVSVSDLATTLAAGTSVTLQASNDLMLASDLKVGGSTGGDLTLVAGRRVLIDGDITTANGDLVIKANASVSDGVVNAERNSGAAVISAADSTIEAGTGAVRMTVGTGAGLTNATSGDVTLGGIRAGSILVENLGATGGSDIVLTGQLAATGDITLATMAGEFKNDLGATALSSEAGRWLVYAGSWSGSVENGLVVAAGSSMPRLYNQTYAGSPASSVASGNHFLYRAQPTATVYVNNQSKVYGTADPTLTYYAYGLVNDDGVQDSYESAGFSAPTLTLPTIADETRRAAGQHTISVAYTQTGSNAGYVVNAGTSGTLTVTRKALTLEGLLANSKTYDGSSAATLASLGTVSGVLSGDDVQIDSSAASASFSDAHAAVGKTVNIDGISLSGSQASNYSVSNLSTTATINRKTVTLTSFSAVDKVYDGGTSAQIANYGSLSDLVDTETLTLSGGSAYFDNKNAGVGKTVRLANISLSSGTGYAGDYVLSSQLPSTTATISPKDISASGARVYDGTTGVQAGALSLLGVIGADSVSLQGVGSMADKHVGNSKAVTLGTLDLTGSAAGNYMLGSTSINVLPRALAVSGMTVQNRVYDGTTQANYTGTPTVAGGLLADDDASLNVDNLSIAFATKNAGFNKTLVATGLSLTGNDAANYEIVVGDKASIVPRSLSVGMQVQNKIYDGTTSASATFTDNRIAGDVLSISGQALFSDKNAGLNKSVSASVAIAGVDAANYLANPAVSAVADISKRALHVEATARDKVYDRSDVAVVSLTDDRVAGDDLTLLAQATFENKNVGADRQVTGTVLASGRDTVNYVFDGNLRLAADITPKGLLADGARVYDGTVQVAATDLALAGVLSGDTVGLSGSGDMADKRVGLNKSLITLNGLALSGADASNYALSGAQVDITPRSLTVSGISAQDKIYDGTKTATATGTPVLSGTVISNDDVVAVPTPSITVEFADKNAGQNKTLLVAGGLLSGVDAENYQVVVQGTANIAQRDLGIAVSARSKVYDGTRTADLDLSDSRVLNDALNISATGTFADKHVGVDKPVAVTMTVSGLDAVNYTYTPVTSSTAGITPRPLTITAEASDRVYDGTTAAQLRLTDDRVSGDSLNVAGVGTFADKNAGTDKTVNVALNLGGFDIGNYSYETSDTTTADISRKVLNFEQLTVLDKVYDGTAAASTSGTLSVSGGLIAGDVVSADSSAAIATFADKNAGVGKAVRVTGVVLNGMDSANYTVASLAGTANILRKTIDVRGLTPESKVYDGTKRATVSGSPDITAAFVTGDDVALNVGNFSVEFDDKNVGANKALHVTGNLLTGTDAGNYDPLLNTTGSITARPLTFVVSAQDKTYDGGTAATINFSDNRVTGDQLNLLGTGRFVDKNAGASKNVTVSAIALSGQDAGNYSYSSLDTTTTASINPRTLMATGSKVYDGGTDILSASLGFDGLVTDDIVNLNGSVAMVDKRVGVNKAINGTLLLDGVDAQNYVLGGLQYTVTPKDLNVSGLTAESKVYDGTTNATATGTPTIGLELIAGDTVTANLNSISVAFLDKNVGVGKSLQVTGNILSGADAGNYRALLDAVANITPRQIYVTGVDAQNKVYDGTTTATKTLTGVPALSGSIVSGDQVAVDVANLTVAFADKNAGTGKSLLITGASLTGSDAANYQVSVQNATADISPRTLSLTAQDKVYDGGTTASYTDDRLGADKLSISATAAFADKNAGTGKSVSISNIALSGDDAGNYAIASSTSSSADISPRTLSLTAQDKVYDGGTTASYTDDRLGADKLSISATAAFADKNAGTGKSVSISNIALSGDDAGNYAIASSTSSSADISPRTLSLTAQDKVYDGGTTASYTDDRLGADKLSISATAAFADKNAGTGKSVSISNIALSGDDAGNYAIASSTSSSADISPRTLSLTAQDKVYDGGTTASYTDDRLGADKLSISATAAFADKNAGTGKSVSISNIALSGDDAGNYAIASSTSSSADISPRTLSLTAQDKVYDGGTTASYTDDRLGADKLSISATAAFADKNAGTGKSVSISNIALSGDDAGNYAIASSTSSSADISPRTLSLTAQDKVYDGGTTASYTDDRLGADKLSISATAAFADKNAGTGKSVSISNIALSGDDAGNYAIASSTSSSADISPRTLSLTAQDKVYDGGTTASYTDDRLGADKLSISATAAFADKNAGTGKSVSISNIALSGDDAGNYAIASSTSSSADISRRPVSVTANNVVLMAGEPAPDVYGYSISQNGLVEGETFESVSIAPPSGLASAVGGEVLGLRPSNVLFSGGAANNYDVRLIDGYLIVVPKAADLARDNQDIVNTAFFLELDPADIALVSGELQQQQTTLASNGPEMVASPLIANAPSSAVASAADSDQIKKLTQQLLLAAQGNSASLISALRAQPLLLWSQDLLANLLNVNDQK